MHSLDSQEYFFFLLFVCIFFVNLCRLPSGPNERFWNNNWWWEDDHSCVFCYFPQDVKKKIIEKRADLTRTLLAIHVILAHKTWDRPLSQESDDLELLVIHFLSHPASLLFSLFSLFSSLSLSWYIKKFLKEEKVPEILLNLMDDSASLTQSQPAVNHAKESRAYHVTLIRFESHNLFRTTLYRQSHNRKETKWLVVVSLF